VHDSDICGIYETYIDCFLSNPKRSRKTRKFKPAFREEQGPM
jgi:hypothetical protein